MPAKQILLVEDNRDHEELTLLALEGSNVQNEVVVAHDGAEALDYLFATGRYTGRDASDLPQVVLLDLKVPKINGFEVLRRIRGDQRTRFVPVVVLTSSQEAEDIEQSYELGTNSYVRKPVDFREFTTAIGTVGMFWMLNQVPGDAR